MGKKSFVLYTDYLEQLLYLSTEERGMLITAVFEYAQSGKMPDFTGILGMSFTAIKTHMDRDAEKYEEVKKKRSEAGRISGQIRKEKREQKGTNVNFVEQKGTKRTVNVNDNDIDNVNDNDNVIVNVNENVIDNDNESVSDNEQLHHTPTEISDLKKENNSVNNPKNTNINEKIRYAEFVTMTNAEYNALVDKFGEADTLKMIEILDNYKGATGKVYVNDYRVMCSWVYDRLRKDKEREKRNHTDVNDYLFGDNLDHEQLIPLTQKKL